MSGGFFEKLKVGLSRTTTALSNLFARPMDESSAEKLRELLLAGDFGVTTTEEAVQAAKSAWKNNTEIRQAGPAEAAAKVIESVLENCGEWHPPAQKPVVIMLLGINGAGKTTTAAKLVARWQKNGQRCILGACDTFRAAASEQLNRWAQKTGADIVSGAAGADPAAIAFDAIKAGVARNADYIILDTAGRLHTKTHLLEELRKIVRVTDKALTGAPHEKWLVVDGSLGANSLEQAKVFHEAVQLTGIIVTKLDGSAKGGALVAIVRELGIPVRFIGLGETTEDLVPFNKKAYARSVVGLEV
jgi:fused signal recognition particle receptor